MTEEHSPPTLGDMVVSLIAELQERVELTGEARRVVLLAIALAANNGRLFGMDEVRALAAEGGIDLDLPGEVDAPSTLAQALGQA